MLCLRKCDLLLSLSLSVSLRLLHNKHNNIDYECLATNPGRGSEVGRGTFPLEQRTCPAPHHGGAGLELGRAVDSRRPSGNSLQGGGVGVLQEGHRGVIKLAHHFRIDKPGSILNGNY